MKKIIATTAALFLIGCGSPAKPPVESTDTVTDTTTTTVPTTTDSEANLSEFNITLPAPAVDKYLVSFKVLDYISADDMLKYAQKLDPNIKSAYGYKAVKLVYYTTNTNNQTVKASGVLVVPIVGDKNYPISIVVDNHGTTFEDKDVPSNVEVQDSAPNLKTATLFTGIEGFATVLPDYLGYGESNGYLHPYIMKYSARASIDMLNAAKEYLEEYYNFTNDVFITGYSEGGYVAMEMAREMQENNTTYNIKALAPMAGPYDVEKLGVYDLNDSRKMVFPPFLAFIAYSYSKAYDFDLSKIVLKSDVFNNINLFGGGYDAVEINYYLGLTDLENNDYGFNTHYPDELFLKDFLDDFESNPSNTLRLALKANSNYEWVPKMPVNIVNCKDDEIIPYFIADEANQTMHALGATNVTLTAIDSSEIPPATTTEPFVHQRCAYPAYATAAKFFYLLK